MKTYVLLAAMPTWPSGRACRAGLVVLPPTILMSGASSGRSACLGEPDGDRIHVEEVVDVLPMASFSLS